MMLLTMNILFCFWANDTADDMIIFKKNKDAYMRGGDSLRWAKMSWRSLIVLGLTTLSNCCLGLFGDAFGGIFVCSYV